MQGDMIAAYIAASAAHETDEDIEKASARVRTFHVRHRLMILMPRSPPSPPSRRVSASAGIF